MESYENTENPISNNTIQQLAKGIMELYEPPLVTISNHLKELTEKQNAVHSVLSSERKRIEDLQNNAELDALMANIASDKERLMSISNSMMDLHKRVHSLQTRAANIEKVAKQRAASQRNPQS